MLWLDILSLAFSIVGIGLSALGIWTTWKGFRLEGDTFLSPITRRLTAARAAIVSRIGRRRAKAVEISAALTVESALSMRVRTAPGKISTTHNIEELVHELNGRMAQIGNALARIDDQIAAEIAIRTEQVNQLRDDLTSTIEHVHKETRRVATDGLRLEAFGLGVVGLGAVLQIISTLIRATQGG